MDIKQKLLSEDPDNSYAQQIFSFQKALSQAGESNLYQIRTTIFLALQWTVIAFTLQGQAFLFLPPKFLCDGQICKEEQACNTYPITVDPSSPNSLAKQFELYCDKAYLKSLTQSLYFVISNFSVLIFSKISDNKGRKYTILITYIIGTIPLIFASFVNNYIHFMILLIISGIGMSPYVLMCFVLLSESAGDKCRLINNESIRIYFQNVFCFNNF